MVVFFFFVNVLLVGSVDERNGSCDRFVCLYAIIHPKTVKFNDYQKITHAHRRAESCDHKSNKSSCAAYILLRYAKYLRLKPR